MRMAPRVKPAGDGAERASAARIDREPL